MSFELTEAGTIAAALTTAANVSGLPRSIRYELTDRAEEWTRAVEQLADADRQYGPGVAIIDHAVSVGRGMRVLHDRWGWCRVLRKLNDGTSLQMESPDDPRGWWLNFGSSSSPVVVRA